MSYMFLGENRVPYIEDSTMSTVVAIACKQAVSLARYARLCKGSAESALLLIGSGF